MLTNRISVTYNMENIDADFDIFRVEKHPMDSGKLMLTINRQPIVQWFKEQWEKLQQNLRNSVQREQKSRGFRI